MARTNVQGISFIKFGTIYKGFPFIKFSEEFIKDFLNKKIPPRLVLHVLCWNPTPASLARAVTSLARAVTSLARAVRSHQYSDAFCDKNTVLKAFGNKYIALQYLAFCISSAGFQASAPTCCDGWWMVDGGWMDGQRKLKKIMYFKNFSNTIRYFFLVFRVPLEDFLRHFLGKARKIKFL